jgi:hypothetical protein
VSWEVAIGLFHVAVTAVYGWLCYRLGWKRGAALTPNDQVLRDVARQRDSLMRERDEANAALTRMSRSHIVLEVELMRLRSAMQSGSRGPN